MVIYKRCDGRYDQKVKNTGVKTTTQFMTNVTNRRSLLPFYKAVTPVTQVIVEVRKIM